MLRRSRVCLAVTSGLILMGSVSSAQDINPDRTPEIIADLTGSGVRITKVEPFEPSLEDLYFAARKEAREDGIIIDSPEGQETSRAESASSEPETSGLSGRGA